MSEERAPTRLVELSGPAGDCLREALSSEPALELPRFTHLRERRLRRLHRRGAALAGCALALAALPLFRALDTTQAPATASITAEPARGPAAALAVSNMLLAEPEPTRPAPAPPIASAQPAAAQSQPRNMLAPSRRPLQPAARATPAAPSIPTSGADTATNTETTTPPSPSLPARSAGDCAELARSGTAAAALDCYRELARGSGVTAELALFEQARLEGKLLRDPARALATLQEHRQRFPKGSLRAEVLLAQIEWLLAQGDEARALQAVEEALASNALRERTAELERVRARLWSSLKPAPP